MCSKIFSSYLILNIQLIVAIFQFYFILFKTERKNPYKVFHMFEEFRCNFTYTRVYMRAIMLCMNFNIYFKMFKCSNFSLNIEACSVSCTHIHILHYILLNEFQMFISVRLCFVSSIQCCQIRYRKKRERKTKKQRDNGF